MAGRINVERPEFNLRDKLNELSFERLPSQKMPKGDPVVPVFERRVGLWRSLEKVKSFD